MYASDNPTKCLEDNALHHLDSVDLLTPMRQLDDVMSALIEVPTRERRSDTEFARQVSVAVDMLILRTHRLVDRVHLLTEHVNGSMAPKMLWWN